jgi:hypothetical protein
MWCSLSANARSSQNMRSRAILLPSIGDPFLLELWFSRSYPKFKNEVDHVYICLDSNQNEKWQSEVKQHIIETYSKLPNISIFFSEKAGLSSTIETAFKRCQHTYFAYIQEDAYVYKEGEVDRCFELLECDTVDVVATPMYCYSGILNGLLSDVTGGKEPYLHHLGFAFWQNFFFSSVKTIRETNCNFEPKQYRKGERIPYLNQEAPDTVSLDVMAEISFQLRVLGKRFKYVSQGLGVHDLNFSPLDVNFWQHVNSLSSITTYLVNETAMPPVGDESVSLKTELERRVAWWIVAAKTHGVPKDLTSPIGRYYWRYAAMINKIISDYKLDQKNVDKRVNIIERILQ